MTQTKIIYCSGPLFSPEEIAAMARIGMVLEKAGYGTFIPHRDGLERFVMQFTRTPGPGIPGASLVSRKIGRIIFALDLYQVVERCDALVYNMNGRVPDEGGAVETAIAFAVGKPLIIYKQDARSTFNGFDNAMLLGLTHNYSTVDEVDKLPADLEKVMKTGAEGDANPNRERFIPPHLRRELTLGRRVWRFLQKAPAPKSNRDIAELIEELAKL